MAKKDKNEQEYVITEEGVEQAVTSALEQYSEGEITKNDKKTNFFTLKMFGKNIGGAILGKNSKKEIEGKYLHNTEENVQNVTKLILDSAKKHKGIAIPPPIPVPVETQQNEQEQTTNKEQPKKRKIILPIAMATLIGGAIGAAIASRADTIIDNNNITIEYDSAENTLDALADLEQSSDDLIDENAILADLIKGTNSDIRDEADRIGKTFSEDERVESETTAISYSDEVNELRTQRDNAIVKYSLIKEPTNEDKLAYTLEQLDIKSKALNFKNEKLQILLDAKDIQSGLIQEHSDAGYSKEAHSKELKGNDALGQILQESAQDMQADIARNNQMLAHFKNLDLTKIQDFDEYFNAYATGIQSTDIDKLEEFEQVFNNYTEYIKSYKADFKADDFQRYMPTYREGIEKGKNIDEINKQFDKEVNPNKFFDFFRE